MQDRLLRIHLKGYPEWRQIWPHTTTYQVIFEIIHKPIPFELPLESPHFDICIEEESFIPIILDSPVVTAIKRGSHLSMSSRSAASDLSNIAIEKHLGLSSNERRKVIMHLLPFSWANFLYRNGTDSDGEIV